MILSTVAMSGNWSVRVMHSPLKRYEPFGQAGRFIGRIAEIFICRPWSQSATTNARRRCINVVNFMKSEGSLRISGIGRIGYEKSDELFKKLILLKRQLRYKCFHLDSCHYVLT